MGYLCSRSARRLASGTNRSTYPDLGDAAEITGRGTSAIGRSGRESLGEGASEAPRINRPEGDSGEPH